MIGLKTPNKDDRQYYEVSQVVARIQSGVLAVVCGLLGGLMIFMMTAWLLLKGGPNVGQHLQLLSQYFIGYSVTWPGSLIGFGYGVVVGGVMGWIVGKIYNVIVALRYR